MAVVFGVQVAVVQIIEVIAVGHGLMSAVGTMDVRVLGVG